MNFNILRQTAAASPHPTDKIAAQILYRDGSYDPAHFNARPDAVVARHVPLTLKIADRSLYVHAETRALVSATRATRGASLLVSDPFCPNCAKQIALAGIRRIVIDGAGFAKLYFAKNEQAFRTLSLSVATLYGVKVFVADDGGTLTELRPPQQVIRAVVNVEQRAILPTLQGLYRRQVVAHGLMFLSDDFTAKYDPLVDAATHALVRCIKMGRKPDVTRPAVLSHWPNNPRPFIDLLGAGIMRFQIQDAHPAPEWAGSLAGLGVEIIPR